jgi:hypothetical protein
MLLFVYDLMYNKFIQPLIWGIYNTRYKSLMKQTKEFYFAKKARVDVYLWIHDELLVLFNLKI